MQFPVIFLLGIGVFGGIQADTDCSPKPDEKNIALTGVATQSSVGYDGPPGLAIDGNQDSNHLRGSCMHTGYDKNPWWQVDLQKSWKVKSVVVVNRGDCCSERLKGAEIRVGDRADNNNPVCGTITDISLGSVSRFCCNGMEGRFISVVIPNHAEWLQLCEVEVYPALQDHSECL
ncbi:fucolectin-5-like [Rhinatrema bivittatum]|uniref:fucolectin-5-like n=1 Tax=Rhinatrema bivittatum TaxID=194408 RepID=UPI00112E3DD2|nr:fucolectin-5-like [Rhinatrema bivittatum]